MDDHNSAVLQAQARAAEHLRTQREETELAERRARAVEATQDRLRRLMGGASRRIRNGETTSGPSCPPRRRRSASRDRIDWRGRDDHHEDRDLTYKQSSRKRRCEGEDYSQSRSSQNHSSSRHASPTREGEHRSRHRPPEYTSRAGRRSQHARPPSPARELETGSSEAHLAYAESASRHQKRARSSSSGSGSYERRHRSKRHRNRSESPQTRSRGRTPSPSSSLTRSRDNDGKERRSYKSPRGPERDSKKRTKYGHRPERETEKKEKFKDEDNFEDDTLPVSQPAHSSKMDKYFDPAYDPALDYTPVLDTNSMVQDGAFDSWNTMLQLIRIRREDKEAKKRREKEGESGSSSNSKRPSGDPGLIDIVYKKRGSVREWDLGKD